MATSTRPPCVSIVVATYNRSNVLALAIESARAQTFEDWELWVVGDACTDDTEEVVRSFRDERIRFVNLAENWGEQSRPNNEGVARSAGNYVAFLNHDDLWFPDHLERTVAALERGSASMVFAVVGLVDLDGTVRLVPSWSGRYEPLRVVAPASGWLVRRETVEHVGPWRPARDLLLAPSQDWLRRARSAGMELEQVPHLTVLAVQSGSRPGSYARRDDREQRELLARMRDPGFREELLGEIAVRTCAELARPRPVAWHAGRAGRDVIGRVLGSRLPTVRAVVKYRRRGAFLERLREARGLPAK